MDPVARTSSTMTQQDGHPAENPDAIAANTMFEIIAAKCPGDPIGEIGRLSDVANNIAMLFDAADNNDTDTLAHALLKYELDNDIDANVSYRLMCAAGKHANIEAIGLIYDIIPTSAMYLLTAAILAANTNTHVAEIIFWHCHDHYLATKNVQAGFVTDLMNHTCEDDLQAISVSAQAFIQSYCFTTASRPPVFRPIYTPAARLQEVIDDSNADPDLVRCAYTQDLTGLAQHVHHAQPHDIYHVFWWAGFHTNAQMIHLVIDHFHAVPMKIYMKLYAVLQGLSQSDGPIDIVAATTRIVASLAWTSLPANIAAEFITDYSNAVPLCALFCPELIEQLKHAPNKQVYRTLMNPNECLCGA